jgi:hypothetical protein
LATHGIFSEATAARMIERNRDAIEERLIRLRKKLQQALAYPAQHDPVYQTCQRIFGRESKLVLGVDSDRRLKQVIREKAIRRFYLGCPPRKARETSIGDAVNWEWMVHCAEKNDAELVILTRDQDYGVMMGDRLYLNDHLKQEFKERVSKKRNVQLFNRASQALKPFDVKVSKEVVRDELDFPLVVPETVASPKPDLMELMRQLTERVADNAKARDELAWLDADDDPPPSDEPDPFGPASDDEDVPPPSDADYDVPPPPGDEGSNG